MIAIKIKDFEGPLDLLLHLVSKYEMDIYDVPIVPIIEQYLAYLETLQRMKLEVAGEYMVMASQLMLIKSRKLLPVIEEEEPLEDDPEIELLTQLEEYRRFKEISQSLSDYHADRAQYFSKAKTELIYDDIELVQDKTSMDLFLTFSRLLQQKKEEFAVNHTTIEKEDYRIEDMMDKLLHRIGQEKRLNLTTIFKQSQSINELVTLFLATLELIKNQTFCVKQKETFGEIILERKGNDEIS